MKTIEAPQSALKGLSYDWRVNELVMLYGGPDIALRERYARFSGLRDDNLYVRESPQYAEEKLSATIGALVRVSTTGFNVPLVKTIYA